MDPLRGRMKGGRAWKLLPTSDSLSSSGTTSDDDDTSSSTNEEEEEEEAEEEEDESDDAFVAFAMGGHPDDTPLLPINSGGNYAGNTSRSVHFRPYKKRRKRRRISSSSLLKPKPPSSHSASSREKGKEKVDDLEANVNAEIFRRSLAGPNTKSSTYVSFGEDNPKLPQDVADKIFYCMHADPPSLLAASQVCRRWRRIIKATPDHNNAVQQYVDPLRSASTYRRREKRAVRADDWGKRVGWATSTPLHDQLTACMLCLALVLAVLKLEEIISWNWAVVLLPLVVVMLQALFAFVSFNTWTFVFRDVESLYDGLPGNLHAGLGPHEHACWNAAMLRSWRHRIGVYTVVLPLAVFFVLLTVKLSFVSSSPSTSSSPPSSSSSDPSPSFSDGDLSWKGVFSPLFVAGFFWLFQVTTSCMSRPSELRSSLSHSALERLLLAIIPGIFFLLGSISILLKIDGTVSWNWPTVFVPFWLLYACLLIGPCIVSCCARFYEGAHCWKKDISLYYFLSSCAFLCFAIPFLVFQILLCISLEDGGGWSWFVVFSPLLAMMGASWLLLTCWHLCYPVVS